MGGISTRPGSGGGGKGQPPKNPPPSSIPRLQDVLGRGTELANKGDLRGAVQWYDAQMKRFPKGAPSELEVERRRVMDLLAKQTPDPFSTAVMEAARATWRRNQMGGRRASFVTGPRGIEGPMASLIGGGGTSLMGS